MILRLMRKSAYDSTSLQWQDRTTPNERRRGEQHHYAEASHGHSYEVHSAGGEHKGKFLAVHNHSRGGNHGDRSHRIGDFHGHIADAFMGAHLHNQETRSARGKLS